MTPRISAVEPGLSSGPAMIWPVAELSGKTIVSFSDAHSPPKLGRELTVFEGVLSYRGLAEALAQNRVAYTMEFYPEEGKYHYNGHRNCNVRQTPEDTRRRGSRCPVCGRPLTLGVLHRVEQLSQGTQAAIRDSDGFIRSPQGRPPFIRLLPLLEIIAVTLGQGAATKGGGSGGPADAASAGRRTERPGARQPCRPRGGGRGEVGPGHPEGPVGRHLGGAGIRRPLRENPHLAGDG